MDKVKRMKLYSEKDYTDTIDFPVELVGRDGVVRKYSYADSIRIYERRIESAHIRYADREIINAEISHCSKRLEQIRRSWKQRIHLFERQYVENRPILKDRELYERGKQFLRGYIEQILPGLDEASEVQEPNLVILEDGRDAQVFYVNWPVFHSGTLLYVYRIEGTEGDRFHEEYLNYLSLLRQMKHAPDTEKLVYHEAHSDIAFIITGPRSDPFVKRRDSMRSVMVRILGGPENVVFGDLGWVEGVLDGAENVDAGPYRLGLDELRWNDFESAYGHFKEALEENPFHKEAYWALGEISDILGRWKDSEPYLLMALKYFPDEAKSHFYHGQVLLNRQRIAEAEEAFERAVKLNMRQSRGYGFLACTQALSSRYRQAAETLERGLKTFPKDRTLQRLAVPLHGALIWHRRLLALSIFALFIVGAAAWASGGLGGWLAFVFTCLALTLVFVHRRREISKQLWAWTRPQ